MDDDFRDAMRERLVHWLEDDGQQTEGIEIIGCLPILWSD